MNESQWDHDNAWIAEAIERAGLFLVPLDEVRGWWRYHHLFADLLRTRLQAEQPGRVPALHRAAATWCEEHDLADDAVRHALAAGDAAWDARLVERHAETLPGSSARRSASAGVHWLDGRLGPAERGLAEVLAELRAAGEAGRRLGGEPTQVFRAGEGGAEFFAGFLAMRVCYELGQVQRAQGTLDAALATYRRALEGAGESSQPPYLGLAHVGLAQILYERNELTAALDHATRGVTLCRQLAYPPPQATGLRACGRADAVPPPRRSAAAPPDMTEPLTGRELEVLRLIAVGRSNQRIARELFVALDTVKKHVTHLLGKLGAANRTEATARARQLGLIP